LMLTRRVRQRVLLLRPSKKTNQLVGYVLAVFARKYGIKIMAVDVLSNHWHVVVHDPDGNVVEFQRDCHQFIARGLNAGHGDFEAVASGSPERAGLEFSHSGHVEEVMRRKGIAELHTQSRWDDHELLRFLAAAGFERAPRLVLNREVGPVAW